jgi:hypothetical protein
LTIRSLFTTPDQFGFSTVIGYDNYHFGTIDWNQIPNDSLIVASDEIISGQSPIKTFNFSNSQPAFTIYQKK